MDDRVNELEWFLKDFEWRASWNQEKSSNSVVKIVARINSLELKFWDLEEEVDNANTVPPEDLFGGPSLTSSNAISS